MSFSVELPLRLISTANAREHWTAKAARAKKHRDAAYFGVWETPRGNVRWEKKIPSPPCVVTITRIGPRKLDDDNLANSAKSVRDGIADRLGVDDGSDLIEWRYAQEKRKDYAVRIHIEALAAVGIQRGRS